MSVEAVRYVLERSKTKGAQRLILLVIAEHANKDGVAWPGIETIARLANCSERYVKKTIACLDAGELILDRGGGRRRTHRYRIPLERMNSASPFSGVETVNSDAVKVNSLQETVNSDAQKGEPQFTRTIMNHQNTTIKNPAHQNSNQNYGNAF